MKENPMLVILLAYVSILQFNKLNIYIISIAMYYNFIAAFLSLLYIKLFYLFILFYFPTHIHSEAQFKQYLCKYF